MVSLPNSMANGMTSQPSIIRLGVNIDHVATLRNARGGTHPDPVEAARIAARAGADGCTAHLREDRRHIRDHDIPRLINDVPLPLNLEMAATAEMAEIALGFKPHACCLVPERREELTTEGGLDVVGAGHLRDYLAPLNDAGIRTSLFIDPDEAQIRASAAAGAHGVELHTGTYCNSEGAARADELVRLEQCARLARELGLECHAGHGLTYDTVQAVARIPEIVELNIGHFLIGAAIYSGLEAAVGRMRALMDEAVDMRA